MRHLQPKPAGFVFILLAIFLVSGAASASALIDDVPLSRALDRLAAVSGTSIVYSSDTVNAGMRVALPARDADLESTLHHWLAQWGLDFERVHGVIVIRRVDGNRESEGVIAGRVRHAVSGVPLAGIEVQTAGGRIHATSTFNGEFLLEPVPRGRHTVLLASRGWAIVKPETITVDASGIAFVTIDVVENVYPLDAVVVAPSFYELDRTRINASTRLDEKDIEAAPKLGGEVLKSVGYLPGVMQSGASARSHLHGGAANETLYLFDGIRLYDPFHLRDFLAPFSFLDPQRVASANVRVGSFPVSFGNRLSGVIEFEPVEAYARFGGEIDVNVFSTGFLVSDSFDNPSTSWVASARRGHLDFLVDAFDSNAGSPSYFDAYLRLEHETAQGLRLSGSFLGAQDRLIINTPDGEQSTRADYDDQYYWFRATWPIARDLEIATTFSSTNLASLRTGTVDDPDEFSGAVSDQRDIDLEGVSADVIWHITPRYRLKAGFGTEEREAEFGYHAKRRVRGPLGTAGGNGDFERDLNGLFTGNAQYVYAELRSGIGETVYADIGLRVDWQSQPEERYLHVSPRLGFSWKLNEAHTLRLSGGRYWQAMGIEELPIEDGMQHYLPPERADNVVAEWDYRVSPDLGFRAELFFRKIHDPWARSENLLDPLSLVPELESDRILLEPESARVRGVEASLVKETTDEGNAYWLAVSFSRATDRINGHEIARSWDQQWRVQAGARWILGQWTVESIAHVSAGQPVTPLLLEAGSDPPVIRPGEINSEDLPVAHGLDLRVSREWQDGRNQYAFYLEAINAYRGSNVCCVKYSLQEADGRYSLQRQQDQWYGVVPNAGFRWRF